MTRQQILPCLLCALACAGAALGQQSQNGAGLVYTCTNSHGKNITSDRPIAECVDRVQRVLNSSGLELRRIGPTLTERELIEMATMRRQLEADQAREREERARARALMTRYPNQSSHDQARAEAIERIEKVASVARERQAELRQNREKIQTAIKAYADPSDVPLSLSGQLEENQNAIDEQQRFLDGREAEKERLNQRFDNELAQLRRLWSAGG